MSARLITILSLVALLVACSGDGDLTDAPELRGLPTADVADVIERDAESGYDSDEEQDVASADEVTVGWIADLWEPLAAGDVDEAVSMLANPQICGFVPINEEGDRSTTIQDALAEAGA
jgi:hypothetical protein